MNIHEIALWVLMLAVASGQRLYEVQMEHMSPVRLRDTAHFRCSYVGENITVQYISWTKLSHDGDRTFVYEYSEHPVVNKAYNNFVGRAYVKTDDRRTASYKQRELTYRADENPRDFANGLFPGTLDQRGIRYVDQLRDEGKREYLPDDVPTVYHGEEDALLALDINTPMDDVTESVYGKHKKEENSGPAQMGHTFIPVFQSNDENPGVVDQDVQRKIINDTKSDAMEEYYFQTPGGDYFAGYVDAAAAKAAAKRRKKRSLPMGHMDLYLSDVRVEDEAEYECTVKPMRGPAMSSTMVLTVHVTPDTPIIEGEKQDPYVEGQNVSLVCRANVGKPAGRLTWALHRIADDRFRELPESFVESRLISHPNGTRSAVSRLQMVVSEEDDGAAFKCTASSDVMDAYETMPFAQKTLDVQYPPRGGRILFDTAVGRYYCHARGKPSATYAWIWIRPDGRQTIMSTNRYLDLRGMRQSGYYRFHCLASNIISGIRHTKVMATKLRVIAPEIAPPTTTTRPTPPPTTTTTTTTTTAPPSVLARVTNHYLQEATNPRMINYLDQPNNILRTPTPGTPVMEFRSTFKKPEAKSSFTLGNIKYSEVDYGKPKADYFENPVDEDQEPEEEYKPPVEDDREPVEDVPKYRGREDNEKRVGRTENKVKEKKTVKKEEEEPYYYYYYTNDRNSEFNDYEDDIEAESKEKEQEEKEDEEEPYETEMERVSRTNVDEYNCKKRENGVYGAGCRAFYRCEDGKAYFVECKRPYVYNKKSGKCGKPDQAPAPCGIWRDCAEKENRKFSDVERRCHYYFTCWHGFFMGHNECNPGLVFNERVQLCDWPENVPPPCGRGATTRKRKSRRRKNRGRYAGK